MAIELSALRKSFGEAKVLDGLSLTLPAQGVIGISGPSGCGKTTLLHLLAGLIEPDAGRIDGLTGNRVSMVFQEDRLLPWLTAEDNLTLILQSRPEAQAWLFRMQLEAFAKSYPDQLSGGMKRRLALARGLGFSCDLLLLDEPFQGMDAKLKQHIFPFVQQVALKTPVVLVTHDPGDLAQLADTIFLARGLPLSLQAVELHLFQEHWTQGDD